MNPAVELLRQPKNRPRAIRLLRALLAEEERERARKDAEEAERQLVAEHEQAVDHEAEKARCAEDIIHWINTWVWTYDPRLIGARDPETGARLSPYLRFKLWPKQVEAVHWIRERIERQEEGAWKKSRDAGASYLLMIVALHAWLFEPGFKATFGSRDADLVDTRDDPDSLFEKARIILRRLPEWMMPQGFSWRVHDNSNRIVNPENGGTITGEAGEEMGRGGRSTMFVVDEAAKVKRAEGVEAALSGNTDCVIWVSSANGMGNLFYRKVMNLPAEQVFTLHYNDDPRKTPEWVAKKRGSMDAVNWAAEYEIDFAASMEGICIPAAWVQASQRLLALEPNLRPANKGVAGVDVGAGKAKSVVVPKHGPIVSAPSYRQDGDTTETAYWALEVCKETGCGDLNFDAPGVGAGVASTLSKAEGYPEIKSHPVNTGVPPTERIWPDERTSQQMFGNLKAELWWLARTAFQKTFWHVQHLLGEEGFVPQPLDELIALPADPTLASQLSMVRWFRNEAGKIVIETKLQLQKRSVPSPDFADALMLAYLEPVGERGLGDLSGMGGGDFARANPWAL